MKRNIIIVGITAVLLFTGFFLSQQTSAANEVPAGVTNSVAGQTSASVVSAEGNIEPVRSAELAFELGGQVAEILSADGQAVKAGEAMMRLESADLQLQVQEAEAALAQAQAAFTTAQAQLPVVQAGVIQAELGVAAAEAQLVLLLAPPLPAEVAAAEAGVTAAQAGVGQAAGNREVALNIATEAQVMVAQARVAAAIAQRDSVQQAYDSLIENEQLGAPEEQMRYQLQAAQAEVAAAQAALDALNAGATAAQSQAANAGVAVAAAQRDSAQAQLNLLLAPVTAERVAQAEATIQQAEAAVLQAEVAVQQAETAVSQAAAGVAQAEAALQAAQAGLERVTLVAPFDGWVAAVLPEVGETVTAGVPVVILADFSHWVIKTSDLTELDVVQVGVGAVVAVRVDAIPNEVLSGVVINIASQSTLSRGDVTYVVTVELQETAELPLRWGMTAFVDIEQ